LAKISEKAFEDAIEQHLLDHEYEKIAASDWDAAKAFCPKAVLNFIQGTQPKEWQRLQSTYGAGVEQSVIQEIARQLDRNGMLHVLRHGIKDRGIKYRLAFFKPATTLNPETIELYGKNKLGVMRQVYYDLDNKNSIDMALFVNGLPVATVELKNAFTGQTTSNATRQYIKDRKPTGRTPLIQFKKRALVHFAVDTDEVYMTTRLSGDKTHFLPFNLGCDGGKGNPVNPAGYKTAYLWEHIWQRDTWLDILHRFVHLKVEEKINSNTGQTTRHETMIFPRFHQWDATRKLLDATLTQSLGHNFLIQHSAGSGKTNTISWTAHQLASLHNDNNEPVFDAVIVVSDRRNLDKQLQDNIFQFEHKQGVVELIQPRSGQSKSGILGEALNRGTRIVVTTLQTFSHLFDKVNDLSDKRFAIIADEAHSSQTGKSAANLRVTLGAGASEEEKLKAAEEQDAKAPQEPDSEEKILKWISARGPQKNLSFYAFTATPKKKTIEMFGTMGLDGKPHAFHLYSMRQAIEEGFILDVLKHYTTYKSYYKLTKKIQDDPALDKAKSKRAVARFLTFHGHILDQKTEVMVEHFRRFVKGKINGNAKAMVVTASRLHAVRYKQAFDRYLKDNGYHDIKALVAFSQTVIDPDDESISYTEPGMNGFSESELPTRFDSDEFQILLVAEKYQTGFDQPKLHTMYVDKPLHDLKAVQTLSRLNRTCPGKVDTCVLDFVNTKEDIQEAFKPYYQESEIDEPTDPNVLYQVHTKAMGYGVIWEADIEEYATIFFKAWQEQKKSDHAALNRAVDPAVVRFKEVFTGEHEKDGDKFKKLLRSFVRGYGFISQLYDLQDVELEKFYVYAMALISKLPKGDDSGDIDIDPLVALRYYKPKKTFEGDASLSEGGKELKGGIGEGGGGPAEPELLPLSAILKDFNEKHGTNFSRTDMLCADQAMQDLEQDPVLIEQARQNTMSNFRPAFEEALVEALFQRKDRNEQFFDQLMGNDSALSGLMTIMLHRYYTKATKQHATNAVHDH